MTLVQVFLVLGACRRFDGIRVVQQHAKVTNTTDACLRADRRLTRFNTRVAEDTFLGFAALPVKVDLLVRAAGNTHSPAAAFVLIDQHNAVFFAFVDSAARARRHARRVEAVFAQARQIHHESVFKLAVHRFLHVLEVLSFDSFELTAQIVFPVRAFLDLVHPLTGNQRARAGDGCALLSAGALCSVW